jgi:hypothetical protein
VQQSPPSTPVFLTTATELVDRLGQDRSDAARALAREAQQLADTFRSWERTQPDAHDRSTAVRALLDLQRRAMEHLSTGPGSGNR